MSQRLNAWIRRITDNEMPIFGRTVQEVVSVSEDNDTSAAQLGQVVLKDPAMTSRVLKLANSTYYNPGRQRMSTISRAIMMLGFDTVRSMCLTVSLIDSLVKAEHRKHLEREMARSLHAATQAQQLAVQCKDSNPEELFICALLYHIGDLAFWCFAGEEGDALSRALDEPTHTSDSAQRAVLGFTLKDLSEGLAKEWALSDLLQDSLSKPNSTSPRTQGVVLCHQLAAAAESGWDSDQVTRITGSLAKLARVSSEAMAIQLRENAERAAQTSALYGAPGIASIIPRDTLTELPSDGAPDIVVEAPAAPDPGLQLRILRELTGLMAGQNNFNTVIEMVMEGLHRGVGLSRVMFALLSPDRRTLRAKYLLGDPDDALRDAMTLPMGGSAAAPVRHALGERICVWLHPSAPAAVREHGTEAFYRATGQHSLFLAPVVIRDKPLGLFYADGAGATAALDAEAFDAFRHFTQQANLVLNHLANQR